MSRDKELGTMLNPKTTVATPKRPRSWLSFLLLAGSLAMCLFGALTGQADSVLAKAIKICMECIGLG